MEGDPLPNEHHVSRYCKPTDFDLESCVPFVSAFQRQWKQPGGPETPRLREAYLSVNWIEFFQVANMDAAIQCVRDAFAEKKYSVKPNGRFVVINVAAAKAAALEVDGAQLSFTHKPFDDDESHSAIAGFPDDDLDVATELQLLVSQEDIYFAVVA